jgi:hypothetical protein
MVELEAYFDESGSHDGAKALCVAGYIFTEGQKGPSTVMVAAQPVVLGHFAPPRLGGPDS